MGDAVTQWKVFYHASTPGEGQFIQLPVEMSLDPSDHEVIVEPKRVAICGSDLHALTVYTGSEFVLGHEWTGVVKAVGNQVTSFRAGDVVTSATTIGCGICEYCLEGEEQLCLNPERLGAGMQQGALSSGLKVPMNFLLKLKDHEIDSGVLLEPLAVAQETINLLEKNSLQIPSRKILIIGAGGIGLLEAWLLKKLGAQVSILEIDQERLAFARSHGFDAYRFEFALMDEAFKEAFDIVIDAAGSLNGQKEACRYLSYFGKKRFTAIVVGKYPEGTQLPFSCMQKKQASYIWQASLSRGTLQKTYELYGDSLAELASWVLHAPLPLSGINNACLLAKNKVCPPRVYITI